MVGARLAVTALSEQLLCFPELSQIYQSSPTATGCSAALPPPLPPLAASAPRQPNATAAPPQAPCSFAPAAATPLWVSAGQSPVGAVLLRSLSMLRCCTHVAIRRCPACAGHLSHSPQGFSALHRPDVTFSCGGLLYPVHSMLLAGAWR